MKCDSLLYGDGGGGGELLIGTHPSHAVFINLFLLT